MFDLDGIDKKIFGSGLTILMVFMYFEVRDLRIQIKSLETRLDRHLFMDTTKECTGDTK